MGVAWLALSVWGDYVRMVSIPGETVPLHQDKDGAFHVACTSLTTAASSSSFCAAEGRPGAAGRTNEGV